MGQVERARDLARSLLEEPLPRRWAHTQGVAAQAETLAPILGDDADLLTGAAWLHDIGYSATFVATGFHALDGARHLRDIQQADPRLCNLVAHHTCAIIETEERSLARSPGSEFMPERPALTETMIYCDMTVGPDGQYLPLKDRLREILDRHAAEDLFTDLSPEQGRS